MKKIGPRVSEEKSFKGVYGRTRDRRATDDGRQLITIAHPEGSGELKILVRLVEETFVE